MDEYIAVYLYDMKKLWIVLCMIIIWSSVWAEDLISLRDGRTVKAIIQEVTPTEVKYKRASNPQGPLFVINNSDVKSIVYDNGEVDEFYGLAETEYGAASVDENMSLIGQYHSDISGYNGKKVSKKKSKSGIMSFDLGKESILKDANVTIEICPKVQLYELEKRELGEMVWDPSTRMIPQYKILIKSSSDKILYVDLGNTFRIYGDKRYRCHFNESDGSAQSYYNNDWTDAFGRIYFDSDIYSTSTSSSSSIALGLGSVASTLGIGGKVGNLMNGISVGKESGEGVSRTKINSRILAIPPHGTVELPPYQVLIGKNYYTNYDYFYCYLESDMPCWSVNDFSEEESPYKETFVITYSTDENFSHFANLKFMLYCSSILGINESFLNISWQPKNILGIHERSIIGACRLY
ncbi:MAG: hypothetical protein NC102_07860 [Clostridium sp.]|nr:hypothetical protein [Clostridium sp.]